jgi:mRNA interferase RelE/StbE
MGSADSHGSESRVDTQAYNIDYLPSAEKSLERLDEQTRKRIMDRIDDLAHDPRPSDSEIVQELIKERVRRIRVGDYRVLYQVFDGELLIVVVRVANRADSYDHAVLAALRKSLKSRG